MCLTDEMLKFLNHPVKRGHIEEGIFKITETTTVREAIGLERDEDWRKYFFEYEDSGKVGLTHRGINKLGKWIGIRWDIPRVDDTPRQENHFGFYYTVTCIFPDGERVHRSGEASDRNTDDFSGKFKQNQAEIRAMNKAFLRSNYMELFDMYSEEEADDFRIKKMDALSAENERLRHEHKAVVASMVENCKEKVTKYSDMIKAMAKMVALPKEDDTYPSETLWAVLHQHKDDVKLQEIATSDHHVLAFTARTLLKEKETIEQEKEKEKEEVGHEAETQETNEHAPETPEDDAPPNEEDMDLAVWVSHLSTSEPPQEAEEQ